MTTWTHQRGCGEHFNQPCDCDDVFKHDLWLLTNDAGQDIGCVQRFHDGLSFYGSTANGRTGAMDDLRKCQAAVELMIERGAPRHPRVGK